VLNSQYAISVFQAGTVYPPKTRFCQLLGFAVHLVDAAAGAVFVEFQAIWMLALVFSSRIGALFAFGAGERHNDPCFICHVWLLQLYGVEAGFAPAPTKYLAQTRTLVTTPAPTVWPPSRMANRRPSSIAIGAISSPTIVTLSPGITISTPSGKSRFPVTSVVRK